MSNVQYIIITSFQGDWPGVGLLDATGDHRHQLWEAPLDNFRLRQGGMLLQVQRKQSSRPGAIEGPGGGGGVPLPFIPRNQ